MAKKEVTKTDIIFNEEVIELRSVYSKSDLVYYIQPCKDKNGKHASCIKKTTKDGDMIMSEDERNAYSKGELALFPEDHIFSIKHGKTYHLNDIWEKAEWEAIKNCPLIAKSRDERDANGNLVIDGAKWVSDKLNRSGIGELYIYRPGLTTQKAVSRKKLIHKAESCIFDDEYGVDGRLKMARILGKDMRNQPDASVTEFLLRVAKDEPQKIINLYSGIDTTLRLLLIEARDKNVIRIKNKVYLYGDDIVLGTTDDAVIAWMKDPKNHKLLELIKKDTYPDYYPDENKN